MRTIVKEQNQAESSGAWEDSPNVGDVLGDYRLLSLLGEGGMARVFLGEHVRNERRVAIKVLSADRAMSLTAARAFALEARATKRIDSEHVVDIFDYVQTNPRHRYHVMELLNGDTMRDVMDREPEMAVKRAIHFASQLASALAATHAAGYVHRDVKPENVIVVERDGKPFIKLIDFGAVKDVHDSVVSGEAIVGTPLYMAPEQMWGHGTSAATDVYAFGLMLYEMLAGKLPFKSRKFVELREERSTQEPTPLRTTLRERLRAARDGMARKNIARLTRNEIPAELEALVMACIARKPAERPQSMADVAARLGAMLVAHSKCPSRAFTVHTLPTFSTLVCSPAPRVPCQPRSRSRVAMGYAAAAVAVLISASTLMSDMHVSGPGDQAPIYVASR